MMVVSCLELPNKGLRRVVVRVSCLKDESGTVKVWIERKSGRSIWKS